MSAGVFITVRMEEAKKKQTRVPANPIRKESDRDLRMEDCRAVLFSAPKN